MVLAEASIAALPILTTPNGAGHDIIVEGKNGWVLPIRDPRAFIDRLRWCDAHRLELAAMVRHIYGNTKTRSWDDAAEDLEMIFSNKLKPQPV